MGQIQEDIPMRRSKSLLTLGLTLACAAVPFSLAVRAPAQTFTVLHTFGGGLVDGEYPGGGLVEDPTGNIFGATQEGGAANAGTIFKIDSKGHESLLYSFTGGADGYFPTSTLLLNTNGEMYGVTGFGGDLNCGYSGCGVVFAVDSVGALRVLHTFHFQDGDGPCAFFVCGALVEDPDGNLYGTTDGGGNAMFYGTAFSVSSAGEEQTLYNFCTQADCVDGYGSGNLTRDAAGNLYGVAFEGGVYGLGLLFKIDSSGAYSVLHNFGEGTDGASPWGAPYIDAVGNLYGTTFYGGDLSCESGRGCGIVYKVGANGVETTLHQFHGGTDGGFPYGGLTRDGQGNFYGTTSGGTVTGDYGTVFRLDLKGRETVLHHFKAATDGVYPQAGLLLDARGNLYGTTSGLDAFNYGTVFKIAP
jgi:uncharacterized repeat protein (TIGR03803 family)